MAPAPEPFPLLPDSPWRLELRENKRIKAFSRFEERRQRSGAADIEADVVPPPDPLVDASTQKDGLSMRFNET
ncbi:MAG: hypothetical protein ACOYJQ_05510 [Pseudochelatococcus sp.]|jgi:hypothetical protein|uniref:hypothetical protein n=1 Tax=Pseudochelatococcus sp. TaxID=2020869 RepID=UPI003D8F5360